MDDFHLLRLDYKNLHSLKAAKLGLRWKKNNRARSYFDFISYLGQSSYIEYYTLLQRNTSTDHRSIDWNSNVIMIIIIYRSARCKFVVVATGGRIVEINKSYHYEAIIIALYIIY